MTSKVNGILTLLAVFALLLSAGCGSRPTPKNAAAAEPSGPGMAPEFVLDDVSGNPVRLSDSQGQVRLIDFWATWCAPCREEIPMFKELYQTYHDRGFTILAISDESSNVIKEFVDRHEIGYPNLVGSEQVVTDYGVLALPMAFLIDREGKIVESFVGPKPRKVLEPKIQQLLDQPS